MTTKLRESTLYRGAYLAVSLAVLFMDQWTKGIITRTMEVHQSRTIIPNLFDLTYVRNSGAAFGLFASVDSALKAVLLNSVAVVVFLIVSAYALRSSHKSVRLQVGLALILGGAVGNLLDRVRFGYVVDFLDFAVSGHHWPAGGPPLHGPSRTIFHAELYPEVLPLPLTPMSLPVATPVPPRI